MSDAIKALIDGLDKITDILNIGRLLFYTAAGFFAVLPAAMCLVLLSHDALQPYWTQFFSDLKGAAEHWQVLLLALICGFIVSVLANAVFEFSPGDGTVNEQFYPYLYPRLF